MSKETITQNKEERKNMIRALETEGSLSHEDAVFFENKFDALEHFKNKLDDSKEVSDGSYEEISGEIDNRLSELHLENNNEEEIFNIKQQISAIENEKNTVFESGKEEIDNVADKELESYPEKNLTEQLEQKSLEIGDEVYSNGNFYKIYDIHNPTFEEDQHMWDHGKLDRDNEFQEKTKRLPFKEGSDRLFQEGEKFEDQKRNELKERGPIITAIIKGGEEKIELDSRNIIKITSPEQRDKIVKMQKEEDEAEQKAANFIGLGNTKKSVDKATGQPGKF